MWTYDQPTGNLYAGTKLLATGYSGHAEGKNNPDAVAIHNVGPIPCGSYTITAPHDTTTHGPYVLGLEFDKNNKMFGRSGFLIHGDSIKNPGTASEGCIIMPRWARERIWESGDNRLEVVDFFDSQPVVAPI